MGYMDEWERRNLDEINNHTECAIVELTVDDEEKLKLGICRYIAGDDSDRWDADEFDVIATNAVYGLYGGGHKATIKDIERMSHSHFEDATGLKREKYGRKAVEVDYSIKIISSGKVEKPDDSIMKGLADFRQVEDEECFNENVASSSKQFTESTVQQLYIQLDGEDEFFDGKITTNDTALLKILIDGFNDADINVLKDRPNFCKYARGIPEKYRINDNTYIEFSGEEIFDVLKKLLIKYKLDVVKVPRR